MTPILSSVILLFGIALICGIVLTLTSIFLSVKGDEKTEAIRECLPGANCGACGYTGCDGYAKALSNGEATSTALCVPGGDKAAKEIADILNIGTDGVNAHLRIIFSRLGASSRTEAVSIAIRHHLIDA